MAYARHGPALQRAEQEQAARPTVRGISNSEACRIVGICRRTGNAGDTA
jgi:hypothetical protein